MIDLRSDTVTRPTAAMLQAMMAAPVGDDVMGDDPSVNRLQAAVAERAGKEAGLFFPSGTQSNLAALMAHCERGDEYLVGQLAHTYRYEGGGAAVLGSIQPQPIEHAEDGTLPLERLAEAVKPKGDPHYARTRLLALENTFHGKLIPAAYIEAASAWARGLGLGVHLDGARVFNAAVASGRPLAELCAPFDTCSICFSKGLGAPVGSVLVGSRALIECALRWRKMLGGGLRQSGVLAAACLYALEHNVERLAQDHEHARLLAEGLRGIAGLRVLSQDTNMVFVEFEPSRCDALNAGVAADGILMRAVYGGSTRLVTHLDVSADDVRRVVASVARHLA
ncbi:low-specificity L-threonine aldolase [Achromobacter sp. Marseille-Q0513]|uniref:low-specificity L-threonine aldolase n=1 Tax=Achromobacter sp. Marseille-Q0513 TaxID=2829161 RepID=UPI001B8E6353|nr:low-specificity L-threonine aldolase [Achromobacter sp. Marseille-Q0513]MBR8656172.1 low-specificity L-threonine aldolase [Achromobacter sp. Marseille-Q0513]